MDLALCIFKVFPYGGLQRDFLKFAKYALEKGHRVTCYTMSWEGKVPPGLKLEILPAKGQTNHRRCWNFAKQLNKRLVRARHDKVLGFNRLPGLDFYFAGDLCFQAEAREKHPILSKFLLRYRIFTRLEKKVFHPASKTHILLLNPAQQAVYQKYYHTQTERFCVIPPGIAKPAEYLHQAQARKKLNLPLPQEATWLLMVGRDLKLKGCERNLRALAALPASIKAHTYLMVVGTQKLTHFKKMAKALDIESHLLFLGGREDVDLLMQAADLLVHPAYQEVAGMVLIEALMNRLPVLVTDTCGYAFHIEVAQAGKIIPGKKFSQVFYNEVLKDVLKELGNSLWQENARHYVEMHELSRMVEVIMAYLEG